MGTILYPAISATTIISYGLAAVVIGGLAALIPAWQASRKEPAVSLHYV
jgi:ABC-type antimicrobial peptide transport system permease subunit